MFKAKATGFDQIYVQLQHAGERVSDTARKTMHRTADKMVELAKQMTPVDTHNLEQSIHKEVGYEYRGRLQIQIVAGGFVNGVNVDRYAMEVHEHYDAQHMGPGSRAKQLANPAVIVGAKFITRAVEQHRKKLESAMISAVVKEWKL